MFSAVTEKPNFVKCQIVTILGFVGSMVSVKTIQLCSCSVKASHRQNRIDCISVIISLYLWTVKYQFNIHMSQNISSNHLEM